MSFDVNIRVGVSSCLVGEKVRYDAGHKRDDFVSDALGAFVELVLVCPEVESGMPIPRPAIALRRKTADGEVRLVESKNHDADHTDSMRRFARARIEELKQQDLAGYVFKAKSPSCGVYRVPVQSGATQQAVRDGRGLFAEELIKAMPELPFEEEGRLRDAELRENFVERVFAYARLRDLFRTGASLGELVAFHSREKLLLLAHHPETYKRLGKLVAEGKQLERSELEERYRSQFLEGMAVPATPGKHVNVLQHILGYFKEHLDSGDRAEVLGVFDDYRNGLVPLIVPITLLKLFVRRHAIDYLAMQTYLNPHPKELMLRNRA